VWIVDPYEQIFSIQGFCTALGSESCPIPIILALEPNSKKPTKRNPSVIFSEVRHPFMIANLIDWV
jgi:hypothetical protein